jgi:hypothetical protein
MDSNPGMALHHGMGSLWTDLYCNKEFFKQALTTEGDYLINVNFYKCVNERKQKFFEKKPPEVDLCGSKMKCNILFYSVLFYL